MVDQNDVNSKLLRLIKEMFDIDYIGKWEDIKDINLMSYKLNFEPRELVYLLFEIEKAFNIKIPEEAIVNGSFNNFYNISNIINNQISNV